MTPPTAPRRDTAAGSGHLISGQLPDSVRPAHSPDVSRPDMDADTLSLRVRTPSGHAVLNPLEALMTPYPTIGETVHYVSHGTPLRRDGSQQFPPACRRIVTEVDTDDPGRVGLAVLNPMGTFFHPLAAGGCLYASGTTLGGTWHERKCR